MTLLGSRRQSGRTPIYVNPQVDKQIDIVMQNIASGQLSTPRL